MAVELYRHISAARTAAGKLWTSTTGIDHLGNDWALMSTPFVFYMLESTMPSSTAGGGWSTRGAMEVGFPDDYALDDDFDSLEVAFAITVQSHTTGSTTDAEIRLESGGTTSTAIVVAWTSYGADTRPYHVIVFGAGSEPLGQTTINIQAQWTSDPGSQNLLIKRDDASLDCYLLVQKV